MKTILHFTKHHAMKMYGGVELELHALTLVPDGSEWSASPPDRLTPVKVPPVPFG